eukprot:1568469-Heterocapsa_arctica.AAC.1
MTTDEAIKRHGARRARTPGPLYAKPPVRQDASPLYVRPQPSQQMEAIDVDEQMSRVLGLLQGQMAFQEQMSKQMEQMNEKLTFIEGHLMNLSYGLPEPELMSARSPDLWL